MSMRPVHRLIKAKPTIEGAGVHLNRAFGFGSTSEFDPFLLLDDFRNDVPDDYLAGFPWHPHRGIETITYVLAGTVEHGDSMGNRGAIGPGDLQWMWHIDKYSKVWCDMINNIVAGRRGVFHKHAKSGKFAPLCRSLQSIYPLALNSQSGSAVQLRCLRYLII